MRFTLLLASSVFSTSSIAHEAVCACRTALGVSIMSDVVDIQTSSLETPLASSNPDPRGLLVRDAQIINTLWCMRLLMLQSMKMLTFYLRFWLTDCTRDRALYLPRRPRTRAILSSSDADEGALHGPSTENQVRRQGSIAKRIEGQRLLIKRTRYLGELLQYSLRENTLQYHRMYKSAIALIRKRLKLGNAAVKPENSQTLQQVCSKMSNADKHSL